MIDGTRILRMCRRGPVGNIRMVQGLGQLQPVLLSFERGATTLRIEGVDGRTGQPVWHALPLPRYKAKAKALFAELEAHKAAGTEAPGAKWWREHKERTA